MRLRMIRKMASFFESARLKVGHHEDGDDHDEDRRVLWDHWWQQGWQRSSVYQGIRLLIERKKTENMISHDLWPRSPKCGWWRTRVDVWEAMDMPTLKTGTVWWENYHQLLIFKVRNLTESDKDESALKTACYPDRRPFNDWLGSEQPEDEDRPCQPGSEM